MGEVGNGVLRALARGQAPPTAFEAVIHGHSMGTSLPDGARVLVQPFAARSPQRGDIVLHKAVNGLLVAHRVAVVGQDWSGVPFVITLGDAQVICDMPLSPDEVIGCVTGVWDQQTIQWLAPIMPEASRRGFPSLTSRVCLAIVTSWARLTGVSQRRWLSRKLLRLRRS